MRKLLWGGAVLAGLPVSAAAQPVTGPYVSLGGGVNLQQNEIRLGSINAPVKAVYTFHPGFAGAASVGYGLGNGLRLEIEGDYLDNVVRGGKTVSTETLAYRAGGVEQKYGGFANVVYDLNLGLPVTPYVGLGAGGQEVEHSGFNRSAEGAVATTPIVPTGSPPLGYHRQTLGGFAYQGIAGFSTPVPFLPGLSFTADYHFVGLLDPLPAYQLNATQRVPVRAPGTGFFEGYKNVVVTENRHFANDFNHVIMLGFRYALFQPSAPLPPQAPPPPMTSPLPPAARTYLVFFDWDRADLTARARQIVAQAARASQSGTTQLQVDGYTDLSGTAAYNQRLSVRRAMSVKAELVRDGVPAGEIAIAGHGEKNPLVATAQGVREPQNRRVEIVLR